MKKLLCLVVSLIITTQVFTLSGCSGYWAGENEKQPGDVCCGNDDFQWCKLSIQIIKQPAGGTLINRLTCTFQAIFTWEDQKYWDGAKYNYPKGVDPTPSPYGITLHTYWYNGADRYNEEKTKFDEEHPGGVYTITLTPKQAGLYFDKTFEADFGWSDADGNHNQSSVKAVCTVP